MYNRNIVALFLASAGFSMLIYICHCGRLAIPGNVNHNEQLYGYLYQSNGKPATNVNVTLIASNYVPSTFSKRLINVVGDLSISTDSCCLINGGTDKNGRYSFSSVPLGIYNIFGEGNGNVWYQPQLYITSDTNPLTLKNDTLNPSGSITGTVVTSPLTDSRKIFILLIGGNVVGCPDDSTGNFHIANLAEGTYRICFLAADTGFEILDTVVKVNSGNETVLRPIVLPNRNISLLSNSYSLMKFGIMIHFNMSTFDRDTCQNCYRVAGEWGLANRDPKTFNPTALDCGQWADAAQAAGAKYMILTAKHYDGFCIWPSKHTEYCVKNAGITTDVVQAFVDSASLRGLQIGFFYSIRDITSGHSINFIKSQLTELLTNYGPIACIWFDGWGEGWGTNYKVVPYLEICAVVNALQPKCLIINNNHEFSKKNSEIIEYEIPIDSPPKPGNIWPSEGIEPIRSDGLWFWHPEGYCNIKSPANIIAQMNLCNQRYANYLLNVTPDKTGRIPQCQVDCLISVGTLQNFRKQ